MTTEISVLKLTLHGHLVGYLAGAKNGRNVLHFAESYQSNIARPTFSLTTRPNFPRANKMLSEPWATNQRLHPILSKEHANKSTRLSHVVDLFACSLSSK